MTKLKLYLYKHLDYTTMSAMSAINIEEIITKAVEAVLKSEAVLKILGHQDGSKTYEPFNLAGVDCWFEEGTNNVYDDTEAYIGKYNWKTGELTIEL